MNKMHLLPVLILTGLVTAASLPKPISCSPSNLVANPSFEEAIPDGDHLHPWKATQGARVNNNTDNPDQVGINAYDGTHYV